jgi:hypothetical protein
MNFKTKDIGLCRTVQIYSTQEITKKWKQYLNEIFDRNRMLGTWMKRGAVSLLM